LTILFLAGPSGRVAPYAGGGPGASLNAIVAGRCVRPHGQAVAPAGFKTGLVIPQIRFIGIKDTFRREARVVNPPLPQRLADGFPPAGKPAGHVFLKDPKGPQDNHDQRGVFDQRLAPFPSSA